jgi:hypothetical protein
MVPESPGRSPWITATSRTSRTPRQPKNTASSAGDGHESCRRKGLDRRGASRGGGLPVELRKRPGLQQRRHLVEVVGTPAAWGAMPAARPGTRAAPVQRLLPAR